MGAGELRDGTREWIGERIGAMGKYVLALYLALTGAYAALLVVDIFPETKSLAVQVVGEIATEGDASGADKKSRPTSWRRLDEIKFDPPRFAPCVSSAPSAPAGFVILAVLAGILGACLHGLKSLSDYSGNEQYQKSWSLFYFLRPWIGALLGFVFYFVIRVGFLSTPDGAMSPYGVVAFSSLAGLFADRALAMLSEVFKTVFRVPDKRKDTLEEAGKPVIKKVDPNPVPAGSGDLTLTITGENFGNKSIVKVAKKERATTFVSENELTVKIPAAERPTPKDKVEVVVFNSPSERSLPAKVKFE